MNRHQHSVLLKNATATPVHSVAGMSYHAWRCAIAVPRVVFGFFASPRICARCSKPLPCGLTTGKSLISVAIVVENALGRITADQSDAPSSTLEISLFALAVC